MYRSSTGRTRRSTADGETWDSSGLESKAGGLAQSTESQRPWRPQHPGAETGESSKREELVCTGTSPVKTRENLGRDFAGTYVLLK